MWRKFAQRKALIKTISWRGLSFVITTLGVWLMTGRLTFAASVGLAELMLKSLGYYFHECVWEGIDLHKVWNRVFFAWFQQQGRLLAENQVAIQAEETIV